MRFDDCLLEMIDSEDGKHNGKIDLDNSVDQKTDRGGLTNAGVTNKTYSEYRRRKKLAPRPVTDMEEFELREIYFEYWADANCSALPAPLDLFVFDCAINSGAGRAVKLLQQALGVGVDGLFGKQTLRALSEDVAAFGVYHVCEKYLDEREAWYHDIVRRIPDQKANLRGWLNRLQHLRKKLP